MHSRRQLTTPSTIASSYNATPLRPWNCWLKGAAQASSIGWAPARKATHTRLAGACCRASAPPVLLLLLTLLSAVSTTAAAAGGNTAGLPSGCTTCM
jgi:hypothetical protein